MTILKVLRVRLKINWLFFVVCFLFALVGDLFRVVTVFTAVLLHELGHVMTACYYGLKIKEIELLPFGGVAIFEDMLEIDPKVERNVALAGPLVNFGLVLLLTILIRYGCLNPELALFFISYNLSIGIFNLVPALPLDGGRILRAVFESFYGYWKATHWVLQITRVLALIIGVWAFFSWITGKVGLISLLAAFFVYFAAMKEEEQSIYVLMKYLIQKNTLLLESELVPGQQYLVLGDTMTAKVLKVINPKTFTQFLIYDKDYNFLGTLTEVEVIDAFFEEGKNVPIKELLITK
ncbi:hypothetical protein BBF96_07705 [Anoxybacter fermentans]|uniref:Peptidase M50 domain-containing protein n=1 Tax=Anoxybacter fermentans TaxID=1323375 RepID=A0A3Q9HQE4_9FIRM|nr:M50 family metallopeptidase [Anoxybacter fermentans]AZR73281.1 hypothetical protein BBF96_07705 [Anoxybacter fermentans]